MKTYLYVDFYFLLNFTMNLFLIMVTAMLRQKKCHFLRYVLLSGISAAFSVSVTYFLWGQAFFQAAAAFLQMGGVVYLAYGREGFPVGAGDFLVFLFLVFFTGGLIGAAQVFLLRILEKETAGSMVWILLSVVLIFLIFFLLRFSLIRQGQDRRSVRRAKVVHGGREVEILVLYDTGNRLVSPYTGEGVAVISNELAVELGLEQSQRPVLIPFRSIGGGGLLRAYRLEEMRMEDGACRKDFLVAVSENLGERQEIQMILNIT